MVVDFPTLTQDPPQAVAQASQAAGSYEERYAKAGKRFPGYRYIRMTSYCSWW